MQDTEQRLQKEIWCGTWYIWTSSLVYTRSPGAHCGVYLFAPVCLCRYNRGRCKPSHGWRTQVSFFKRVYQGHEIMTLKLYMQNIQYCKTSEWLNLTRLSSYGITPCLSFIMYLSLTNPCTVRFTSFCRSWQGTSAIYWNHVSRIKHFPSTSNKSAEVDVQTLLQLF